MSVDYLKKLAERQDQLLDELRLRVCAVFTQQGLTPTSSAIDEFCHLATRHRARILDLDRSNKNINHPAKDVINTIALLERQLDELQAELDRTPIDPTHELGWNRHPHKSLSELFEFDYGEAAISPTQLRRFRHNIEASVFADFGVDDDDFSGVAKSRFEDVLWDFLKLIEKHRISIALSKEFTQLSSEGAFFLLSSIFEFCEFNFQWISKKSSSLEGLLHSRLLAIKKKPLRRKVFCEYVGDSQFEFTGIGETLQQARSEISVIGKIPQFSDIKASST
ncbi:MAG: hypothetical protein QM749_15850 [Aquabacterium sp.]